MSDQIRLALAEQNPQALLCDGLEPALVGIATRCSQPALAVYSKRLAVEHLVSEGSEYNEAVEYLEHNTWGAWNGEHTPLTLMIKDVEAHTGLGSSVAAVHAVFETHFEAPIAI